MPNAVCIFTYSYFILDSEPNAIRRSTQRKTKLGRYQIYKTKYILERASFFILPILYSTPF